MVFFKLSAMTPVDAWAMKASQMATENAGHVTEAARADLVTSYSAKSQGLLNPPGVRLSVSTHQQS